MSRRSKICLHGPRPSIVNCAPPSCLAQAATGSSRLVVPATRQVRLDTALMAQPTVWVTPKMFDVSDHPGVMMQARPAALRRGSHESAVDARERVVNTRELIICG